MVKKSVTWTKELLAIRAVELAGDLDWTYLTMRDIANAADLKLAELVVHFTDKDDLLYAYGRYVDQRTLEEAGDFDPELSLRERLFDILMTRLDVLNEQREGVVSILTAFKGDPKQAVLSLPYLARSMNLMLEGAGIDTNGFRGALRITGLKVIYLKTLSIWMRDGSPDMSATMAELDKRLGQVESFAERFGI